MTGAIGNFLHLHTSSRVRHSPQNAKAVARVVTIHFSTGCRVLWPAAPISNRRIKGRIQLGEGVCGVARVSLVARDGDNRRGPIHLRLVTEWVLIIARATKLIGRTK